MFLAAAAIALYVADRMAAMMRVRARRDMTRQQRTDAISRFALQLRPRELTVKSSIIARRASVECGDVSRSK